MKFQTWEKRKMDEEKIKVKRLDGEYWRKHVARINSRAKGRCHNCNMSVFSDDLPKDCPICGEELSQDNLYKK